MKKIFFVTGCLLIVVAILAILRGDEDTWICKNGEWVRHGKPGFEKPIVSCSGDFSLPKDKEGCLKAGGVWAKLGPDPSESCNIKALDRGNICTDSSQCEGTCLAELTREEKDEGMRGKKFKRNGNCSVWRVTLGCQGRVENGVASIICMD